MTPTKSNRKLRVVPPKEQTYADWLATADKEVEKAFKKIKTKGQYLSPKEAKASIAGTILEDFDEEQMKRIGECCRLVGAGIQHMQNVFADLRESAGAVPEDGISAEERLSLQRLPARIIRLAKGFSDDMNRLAEVVVSRFEDYVEDGQ